MTKIADAKAIMEAIAGKSLTNARMISIVESTINYNEEQALTNEEKAAVFVDGLRTTLRSTMHSHAMQKHRSAQEAAATAAGDAAIIDI